MGPLPSSILVALALAGTAASVGRAEEPAVTSPAATSPAASTPAPTSPAECAVSGPASDDRSAPLRAGLPPKKTLIALTREEVRALPDVLPAKVKSHLKREGAWLVAGPPAAHGMIEQKVPWLRDRRATGRLHVTGKRIDAPGGTFGVYINRRYGGKRFAYTVPGDLRFSEPGCWRIKARAGKARVTYVVLVRRPAPGELAPAVP